MLTLPLAGVTSNLQSIVKQGLHSQRHMNPLSRAGWPLERRRSSLFVWGGHTGIMSEHICQVYINHSSIDARRCQASCDVCQRVIMNTPCKFWLCSRSCTSKVQNEADFLIIQSFLSHAEQFMPSFSKTLSTDNKFDNACWRYINSYFLCF